MSDYPIPANCACGKPNTPGFSCCHDCYTALLRELLFNGKGHVTMPKTKAR